MTTPSHTPKPTASSLVTDGIVASGIDWRVELLANGRYLLHVAGLQDRLFRTLGEAMAEVSA